MWIFVTLRHYDVECVETVVILNVLDFGTSFFFKLYLTVLLLKKRKKFNVKIFLSCSFSIASEKHIFQRQSTRPIIWIFQTEKNIHFHFAECKIPTIMKQYERPYQQVHLTVGKCCPCWKTEMKLNSSIWHVSEYNCTNGGSFLSNEIRHNFDRFWQILIMKGYTRVALFDTFV